MRDTAPDADAWQARCLLRAARSGTLATQSGGQPFASLVTPTVAPDGSVLMLLSALSEHTRHLAAEPRCALLVMGLPTEPNPQTAPRLTLTGRALRDDAPELRAAWVSRHPYAALYVDFADFAIWRLVPEGAHFVGGFARARRLDMAGLAPPAEAVAVVAAAEASILSHCNADHADALARIAHAAGGVGPWRMVGVDCDGFDLLQDDTVLRIAFAAPVADAAGVRAELVRLGGAARHWF